MRILILVLAVTVFGVGCSNDDRLVEKAKIEGKESAKAEIQAQLDAKDKLVEKAREEGRATAEAELETQIKNIDKIVEKAKAEGKANAESELNVQMQNIDKIVQKARAEGKAVAEAELNTQNENLERKAKDLESDLNVRHRFYQAVQGVYEGNLKTEKNDFKVRITLFPSLNPYLVKRTRQLDEVVADINNLHLNAQIVQWNPVNNLSAVGCRVEKIRPDITKGEINIASENCPNLYKLRIAVPEAEPEVASNNDGLALSKDQKKRQLKEATKLASFLKDGKMNSISDIRGEVQPTTNASIYSLSVSKVSER